jgi:mono/diheme cytochrome c family protein
MSSRGYAGRRHPRLSFSNGWLMLLSAMGVGVLLAADVAQSAPAAAQRPAAGADAARKAAPTPAARQTSPPAPAQKAPAAQKPAAQKPPPNPEEVYQNVYNGWKWWHVYCFRCHGQNASGSTLAPDLSDPTSDTSEKEFTQVVREGSAIGGMPGWSKLLDEKQIAQLFVYVQARHDRVLPPGRPDEVGPNHGKWVPPAGWPMVRPKGANANTALASLTDPAAPSAADPTAAPAPGGEAVYRDVYNGWKWWHVYCFRCHGQDAIGTTLAPDLSDASRETSEKEFTRVVHDGSAFGGMPGWSKLLSDAQIAQLYVYVSARRDKVLPPGRPDEVGPNRGPWVPPPAWPKRK